MEQFPMLESLFEKNEFCDFETYHAVSQESLTQTNFETPIFHYPANFNKIDEEPFNVPSISSSKNADFWTMESDQHEEKTFQIRKCSTASLDDPSAMTEFKVT